MQNIFSKIYFFLLTLFVFLIPLQAVYIFRQGSIGQDGAAREGIWQFGTFALYATDILFLLIFLCVVLRIALLMRTQEMRKNFFAEISKIKKEPVRIFLLCLLCIAFLSVTWSLDKILALQAALRLFEGVVIFLLLSRMSSARWNMFAWLFVIGACIQGILGAIQFFMQEIPAISWLGISHHAPWILGDAVVENTERRWLRAYGSFPHPNILAAYLVAGYFFCIAAVMRSEKKIQTWFATLAGACILFGLVLTFSREAWLGLAVGLGVMGVVSVYKKRICHSRTNPPAGGDLESSTLSSRAERSEVEGSMCDVHPCRFLHSFQSVGMTNTFISPLFFFFLVSFITILFSSILFSEPLSVRLGIGGWNRLEVKSVQERMGSVKEFLSLGPALVRGVGIGQYTSTLYQNDVKNNAVRLSYAYQPVHNVFLLVLAELGVVGVIAFVGFLFFLGRRICHPERNKAECEDLVGFSGERNCHPDPPAGGEGSRGFQQRIVGFFASLRMTKISVAVLSSFIIISLFDHFFWTIHSGILLWWSCLAGLDKK